MWRAYRLAVLRVLPHAKLVVDKFHVVSKANASLDAVRRSIGKTDQKKQGAGLKKAHKLFAKRATDLTFMQQWRSAPDDERYCEGALSRKD
jgi:transposase